MSPGGHGRVTFPAPGALGRAPKGDAPAPAPARHRPRWPHPRRGRVRTATRPARLAGFCERRERYAALPARVSRSGQGAAEGHSAALAPSRPVAHARAQERSGATTRVAWRWPLQA